MQTHGCGEHEIAIQSQRHVVGAGQEKRVVLAGRVRLEDGLALIELHAYETGRLAVLVPDQAAYASLSDACELDERVAIVVPHFGQLGGGRQHAAADLRRDLVRAVAPIVDVFKTAWYWWPPCRLKTNKILNLAVVNSKTIRFNIICQIHFKMKNLIKN